MSKYFEMNFHNVLPQGEKFSITTSTSWSDQHYPVSNISCAHFHNCYEIFCMSKGEVNYFIENEIYLISPGDIIVAPPNTIHKTTRIKKTERTRTIIFLYESYLNEFLSEKPDLLENIPYLISNKSERFSFVSQLLLQMSEEFNSPNPEPLLIKSLLIQFFFALKRMSDLNPAELFPKNGGKDLGKTIDMVNYVNDHFNEDVTLELLSKIFFVHRNHICRIFKQNIGFTFTAYLTNVRIRNACNLLKEGNLSATEIAAECGFGSCSNFCRTFKTVMGITPLQYKKTN